MPRRELVGLAQKVPYRLADMVGVDTGRREQLGRLARAGHLARREIAGLLDPETIFRFRIEPPEGRCVDERCLKSLALPAKRKIPISHARYTRTGITSSRIARDRGFGAVTGDESTISICSRLDRKRGFRKPAHFSSYYPFVSRDIKGHEGERSGK